MNMTAIITGIFALAKAVPIINSWVNKFVKAWNDKDIKQSDAIRAELKNEKEALNRAISKAETDEDIRLLSITLRRVTNGVLSNG